MSTPIEKLKQLEQRLDAMVRSKLEKLLYGETEDSINESMRHEDYFYRTAFTRVALALLARLDAAEAPCVWNEFLGQYHSACGLGAWEIRPRFCPGCGHPVQVKQKEEE